MYLGEGEDDGVDGVRKLHALDVPVDGCREAAQRTRERLKISRRYHRGGGAQGDLGDALHDLGRSDTHEEVPK